MIVLWKIDTRRHIYATYTKNFVLISIGKKTESG